MQTILHKNDLSNGINFSSIVAADCEMMGLQPNRDPLCLIQLYDGKGDCHLVQFIDQNFDAPNLKKLLSSDKTFIFHYARHDLAAIKHDLNIMIKNVYCTKISSKIARTYSQGHGYKDLCKELLNIDISKKQQSSDWSNPNLSKEQINEWNVLVESMYPLIRGNIVEEKIFDRVIKLKDKMPSRLK